MRNFIGTALIALVATATTCAGHFQITHPPARDNTDDLTELVAPCGGLPIGSRSSFPIVGGYITGTLAHKTAQANFSIVVTDGDPDDAEFHNSRHFIGPGENVDLVFGVFNETGIDLAAAGVPGLVDGAKAILQVEMKSRHGSLTVCMDVALVDNRLTSSSTSSTSTSSVTSTQDASSKTSATENSGPSKASSTSVSYGKGGSKELAISASLPRATTTSAAYVISVFAVAALLFLL